MRCVVPNCENIIGVPFPQEFELQNIWLKNLGINEGIPDVDCFVCYDHFDKNDIEEVVNEDGTYIKTIRTDALPKLIPTQDVIEKETEEFLEFRYPKNDTPQSTTLNEGEIEDTINKLSTDQTVNENSEFQTQFQTFQEGDFILDQQDFTETQNSPQLFTYSENNEITQQEQVDNPEKNLVIQENQDFLTVQHEFEQKPIFTSEGQVFTSEEGQVFTSEGQVFTSEAQAFPEEGQVFTSSEDQVYTTENEAFTTEGQVYTSEGQTLQIYTSEGQPVFTSEGQQVYVSEDQTLYTQDGQQVILSQEPENVENDTTTQISEEIKENEPTPIDPQIVKTEINEGTTVSNEENYNTELIINEEIKQSIPTPPENVVMQWFVPNQTVDTVPEPMITEEQEEIKQQETETVQEIIIKQSPSIPMIQKETEKKETCRLCMSKEQVSISILDNVKDNIMVMEAIQLCIHSLEISLEDPFSKMICYKCFNLLQKFFDFREISLQIDKDQKLEYEKAHPMFKFVEKQKTPIIPKKTHMKTIISPTNRGYRQTEIVTLGNNSKNISRKVILTPTMERKRQHLKKDINVEGVKQLSRSFNDNIQVFKLNKMSNNSSNNGHTSTTKTSIPITVNASKLKDIDLDALIKTQPLSTEKQLKIQEELKKVVEGKMSKDQLSVDQVIVRVVSDDETDDSLEHYPVKKKKFNYVNIVNKFPKQDFNKMKIGKSEVCLPKGIRVSVPDRFESGRGVFPCFTRHGAFGTEFALIDGYLFEYRLCKGKERFLKCLTCSSVASQKLLPNGKFENRALVKSSHNHRQLTNTEIKKQMFFYIMKKKMQADRGLNFRSVYDQICDKDPEIKALVPLRNVINEICKHQLTQKTPHIKTFDEFFNMIEDDSMQKFQFTYSGKQFYQDKFIVEGENSKAVVFANIDTIKKFSHSKLMYVDASFRIDNSENFPYQLVTVLIWIDDSYYPIMFALVNKRTVEIFKKIFFYLHNTLAPNLCPQEIVTDYEANIYYALGETYLNSHIGGSVFYYTQNLYKKICELGLSRELEITSYFRNIYHMLLMLPLLPVNTIKDGLHNIEIQANDLGVSDITSGLFQHIREQWMDKVSPDLFCVHRLENRINENVIAPFKKLRDFLMLTKGKAQKQTLSILNVVEKLIDLENFLQSTYTSENKKSFGRDLSSSQKKNVLKAWQYIETHPRININHFFTKVIGYIKCMENQLWIWGYYKFTGKVTDDLINAANFSIVNTNVIDNNDDKIDEETGDGDDEILEQDINEDTVLVEAVVGPSGEFVISEGGTQQNDTTFFNYVYKK